MQARYGRDTAVLGCVAITLAFLVGCVGATRLSMDLAVYGEPALGDHVRVSADPGLDWSAPVRLQTGATCTIGTGADADTGGELYVVSRDDSGHIEAIWSAKGRSAAHGADCGNGAEVSLDEQTFSNLAAGFFGAGGLSALSTPAVF